MHKACPLQNVAATSDGSETRRGIDAKGCCVVGDLLMMVGVRSGREETHTPAIGTGDGVAFLVAEPTKWIVGKPSR